MYNSCKIKKIISILNEQQDKGKTLSEATNKLFREKNILFDDLWPAVMKIRETSEKEAMQLTKNWCIYSNVERQ